MDFESLLKPGVRGKAEDTVTDANTARSFGSGGLEVYATPCMVALMEKACVAAVDKLLPPGFSTVGTELNVKHLAASARTMPVWAEGTLLSIDGRALSFRVEAFDKAGKIGEGSHGRFIVENEKFLKKAEAANRRFEL
ncbi:dihydrolipoamide acyltransferase [Spirochaetia bacterium]|nr:dihydrolipoamide acyltransferase [Spirochaetia bacterium]